MSELGKIEILKHFQSNLIKFLDALIELFPHISDLIILRVFLAEQIPIDDVVRVFSARILPYKQQILARDDSFFLSGYDIFEGLGSEHVSYFKQIWTSDDVTQDDKDTIWDWFRLFINLCEKYEKCTK